VTNALAFSELIPDSFETLDPRLVQIDPLKTTDFYFNRNKANKPVSFVEWRGQFYKTFYGRNRYLGVAN